MILLSLVVSVVHAIVALPQATPSTSEPAGPASRARLESACGIALDSRRNVFIADRRGNRVFRVDVLSGRMRVVAGTGERGFGGDGGPATDAKLAVPEGVAFDANDNLYIADRSNSRVRRLDAKSGVITTVAGNGEAGYSGDGGKATLASLTYPYGLALDEDGSIYIADTDNLCIRRVDARTGIITTVAGNGRQGFTGDGGPAVEAALYRPHVLTLGAHGELIIGDSFNQRIRRVDPGTGVITTIAGNGEEGTGGNGERAMDTRFTYFGALVVDSSGNLLLTGGDHKIRAIDLRIGVVTTLAGTGEKGFSGDGGYAHKALINGPYGLAVDENDNVYFADGQNRRIRRIDAKTDVITTVAGDGRD